MVFGHPSCLEQPQKPSCFAGRADISAFCAAFRKPSHIRVYNKSFAIRCSESTGPSRRNDGLSRRKPADLDCADFSPGAFPVDILREHAEAQGSHEGVVLK